jgi:Tol biopolymer transport system component
VYKRQLYLIEPFSRQRVAIAQLPFSVGERVYISPQGTHIVYFRESQFEASGQDLGGVYMLDFVIGLRYRLFAIPSLSPRGIAGHAPVWSEDGSLLALVLPTAYATDIFLLNADGTNFRNLTQNEAYDLFPAFSPDGTRLAFVSDRTTCPTYQPQQPNTCDQANLSPPQQGNLFVLDLTTGVSRQVTDVQLTGTPRWLNNQLLAFSTGGGNALAEANTLWLVDVIAGTAVQISPPNVLGVAESWASDGGRVFYQQIGETPRLVLADNLGRELGALTQYNFPRYGVASSWSADGRFLALGGRNGRCPYGIMVFDASLAAVTAPGRNLLACDPQYAPNNVHLAYTGIRPSSASDGRLDIYIANLNGLGATNVTSNLQGQMRLLGWVGRPSAE